MSEVIGALLSSHVPAIGGAIARGAQQEPYWKPFFDGYAPVREWLAEARPTIAVVFYNDHGLNFFLDTIPTFAVGAAHSYTTADEGWGLQSFPAQTGAPGLSWHVIEHLVEHDFDIAMCQQLRIDHALTIPLALAWPEGTPPGLRIVPVAVNTVQHPLPSARRCLALGRAVGEALASYEGDERILIMGTGGLSHQLDGERAGFINPDYDRFCLDHLAHDPDALTRHSVHQIVALAGTQGVEVLNWIAARGALGNAAREVSRTYHVPISNTAAAIQLLETPAARVPAKAEAPPSPAFA